MRFLIVDDDPFKIERVESSLKGHEVVVKNAYNPAMRLLVKEKFDGVVLDMGFPTFEDGTGMKRDKGLLVLHELQRKEIKTPVLVYSGNYFDVREYENVWNYISTSCFDIEDVVTGFIKYCKEQVA